MGTIEVLFHSQMPAKILKWKVSAGTMISPGKVLLLYKTEKDGQDDKTNLEQKLRAKTERGRVSKFLAKTNEVIQPGQRILLLEGCTHPTVMKDLCAECGVDLREGGPGGDSNLISQASVPMVHSIPELKVCPEYAVQIGREDTKRLLRDKKLALLVDLDQTIIHTTNDDILPNIKDVYHYKLPTQRAQWYHTRLRPHTRHFLSEMSKLYELHICTFGVREYAHTVAALLDKDGDLFSHRILSRDECFDPGSKYPNLKALFPCGDDMVCIIDDREDVWQGCGNLVQVKPYYFFRHNANINAPPGMTKSDEPSEPGSSGIGELPEIENEEKNGVQEETSEDQVEKVEDQVEKVEDQVEKVEDQVEKVETDEKVNEKEVTEEKIVDQKDSKNSAITECKDEPVVERANDKNADQEMECKTILEKSEQINYQNTENVTITANKSNNELTPELSKKENNSQVTGNLNNEAKTEEEIDYEDQDDYLLYLEDILRRIHKEYYTDLEKETGRRSLRDIIPKVRARVLKGLTLTFSGIIPTHQKLHQSRAYKVARAFGAQVTQDLTDTTTHLVAMKPGTQKVNMAKKRGGIKIVNPEWLWTCAERWEHVDERLYTLTTKIRASRIPPAHCTNPEPVREAAAVAAAAAAAATETDDFANSINPLFFVSKEEIYDMDKEVEEDMSDAEADPSVYDLDDQVEMTQLGSKREPESSDSNDSLGEFRASSAKRKKEDNSSESDFEKDDQDRTCKIEDEEDDDEDIVSRFRRGEDLPDDLDLGENSLDDSVDVDEVADVEDDGEWNAMGAALEREFLSD